MSTPESREKAVFYAALDVTDPAQRRQFLDEACAGDAELRAAVEELLKTQADAEQFFAEGASSLMPLIGELESAAALEQDGAAFEEAPGTMLGRYKVIEKIGEGGFGVVYTADQEQPVRRRVALKVIKLGMDTKSVIARFEAERQALAMMEHPNIARVFDAGATEIGRPYFVMELVHGVKITEYCDRNQLGMEQRLELFIQICHAIQHAHQKGIIHRDIKPSNILVTLQEGVPMPKVIDFGIAKATEERLTDKTLFTACAQWIGTPAYMSPEQIELSGLDLDTRSDIYSLGVLLYELLTGATPFDTKELLKAGVDEMRRTLREREPTTPSAKLHTLSGKELETTAARRDVDPARLVSQVRGDLDWIVMKALEKDRSRRYETANSLAMDIQRYLDDDPVLARPPSNWYRLQKLVRRNRIVFLAGTAVSAALLIGTVTSTCLLIKEREARQRADAAQRQAETSRATEVQLRHEAELREKVTQAALLAGQGHYEEADQLLSGIALTLPPKAVADALRTRLGPLAEAKAVADVLRTLGEWHALNNRWSQAAERLGMLVSVDQFNDWDRATGDYLQLGPALIEAGDLNGYEQFRQATIARSAGRDGPVADRVIKITLLLPANQQLLQGLQPQVEVAQKTFEEVAERDVFKASWHAEALGLLEYRRGNYGNATNWCRRCLASSVHNAPQDAAAHMILAMACWQLKQYPDALFESSQGQNLIETKFSNGLDSGNSPDGFWYDWVFARILLRECKEMFAEADRSIAQASHSASSPESAAMFRVLGEWHGLRQEWREAGERFCSLLKVNQGSAGEQASSDCLSCGATLIELGDVAGYESFRAGAIARFKDSDNKVIAERIIKISLLRPPDEAVLAGLAPLEKVAVRPFTSTEKNLKDDASYDAWNSMALSLLEYRRGNYAKAADLSRRSLTLVDSLTLPAPTARIILAMSLHRLGQDEAARSELQQAREVIENAFRAKLTYSNWRDWLFGRVLAGEAADLLGVPGK
jgi:serine/threonine protein kinase/tetratricopeptide (TPR) repeat protein